MGLLGTTTQESYYNQAQSFTGNGTTKVFEISINSLNPLPSVETDFEVFINEKLVSPDNYTYSSPNLTFTNTNVNTDIQASDGAPLNNYKVLVRQVGDTEQYGGYQYVSVEDLINNFMVSYVGEDKIIDRVKKADIAFHAQRGIQELSYDTLKSTKSQEIEIPPSLTMVLPQDFVNYVKLTWKDNSGIEHIIYPTRNTSNPLAILQDSEFKYIYDNNGNLQRSLNSLTWDNYSSGADYSTEENDRQTMDVSNVHVSGKRYGITPEYTQSNGSFFIDNLKGVIYFSSNISSKIVTLKYISDGLGVDSEMVVHKFAEEAMYKYMAYAVLASKAKTPEYIVNRFKKERFAAVRKAKLRLSNIKAEELTQIMRNKSKQIKH
jgi:hypothetical protein